MRDELCLAGLRALEVAQRQTEAIPNRDQFEEAVSRFARAVDLADRVRTDWISRGRPLVYETTNGTMIPHPLVKMLMSAEKDARAYGRALLLEPDAIKRAVGRPSGAASADDRKKTRARKL